MIRIWCLAIIAFSGYSLANENGKVFEVDWDGILGNPKTVDEYVNCLSGSGPCVPHSQELKDVLKDVFSTTCGGCTDKQKELFKYSLQKFIPAHQKEWEKILSIFDPTGEYGPKLEAFAGI
ncbi:Insect pheromone-Hypothetical protein family, A10/OS-D [Nesidiocoris tenuis]|uniref:Uncharacterized protein n=1 Tax=Nesidiocoris tenuis TaxID=355587 RepID=A0ABN7B7Q9_9HEMI|nr:Insect pheromone-Hypothetical protein family, A10/OS-D [Nesidiocoris tenuis]